MSIVNLVPARPHVHLLRVLSVIASAVLLLPLGLAGAPPASALERTRTSWALGDFESGGALQPPGWTVNETTGEVRAAASTSRAISGSRSLQVDDGSPSQHASALSSPIQVVGGSTYIFQAYAFAQRGADPQSITVRYHDSAGSVIDQQSTQNTTATMMWTRVLLKTYAPQAAVRATLHISSSASGTGTVWWDTVDYLRPLFYNGQFENTPTHSTDVPWWTVTANQGQVTTTTDQRFVRTGNRALRIKNSNASSAPEVVSRASDGGATYMPKVFPGITHDFTGWVLPVSGTPKLVVSWYDEDRRPISSSYSVVRKPSGEWSYYKAQIAAPLDAAYATLTLTASPGVSEAYWDEMQISPTPPSPQPSYSDQAVAQPLEANAATNTSGSLVIGGRPKLYAGVAGSPARLQVVDVQDNVVSADVEIPGAEAVFAIDDAPNGDIYVGSADGHLYRWRSGVTALEDLGQVTANARTIMDLEVGPDGRVWGAAHPNAEAFVFDPAKDSMTDLGSVSPTDSHARSIAVTGEGAYVGTGPNTPKIVRIDARTLSRSEVKLPADVVSSFVYSLSTRGNFISVKGDFDSSSYRLYDYVNRNWPSMPINAGGQALDNQQPMPLSSSGEFYYTSYKQILGIDGETLETTVRSAPSDLHYAGRDISILKATLDGRTGEWILHYDGTGSVTGLHVETWTVRTWPVSFSSTPLRLKSLAAGSGNTLFSGGFGGPSLGITDLASRTTDQYPERADSKDDSIIGEVEGSISNGGYQFLGTYPGGRIFRYDPSKEWVDGSNPQLIANTSNAKQDRPLAWAAADERTYFGTVPGYGELGGRLGVIDTPGSSPRLIYPSPDRSVVSLAARGSIAYGGTSRWGGYGAAPTQASATVFAYDTATNRKIWEITPQQGAQAVGSVTLAPNGNLWASVGWNLYEIGPNSGTVLRRVSLRSDAQPERLTWSDTSLRFVGSRLYVTIGTAVYSVDTANLHVDRVVADGVSTQISDVLNGRLYYPAGTSIREVTPSAATVETTAKSPYRLDRCETDNDRYVIPYEPGVTYSVDGSRKSTGNYATGGRLSVTVEATAQDGWSLTGKTSWTLELTDRPCS